MKNIISQEEYIEHWGKPNPTITERANMFDEWWNAWSCNSLDLSRLFGQTRINDVYNIKNYFGRCNVIIFGNEARFRNSEDALTCFFVFHDKERLEKYENGDVTF